MSSKTWTASGIRELARKKKKENDEKVLHPVSGKKLSSNSTKPVTNKTKLTEAKGKLSYWNQFEESFGNRIVVAYPSEFEQGEETEILRLCATLGLEVSEELSLRMREPDSATYVGPGQLSRIRRMLQKHDASALVLDVPLKPSQVKNIEKALKVSVVDRHALILSIFEAHAKSRLAQRQVELAQLKYLLPRLAGIWMGLSRQRGAKGGLGGRGLGETRLELDRRFVKDRITFLTKKLVSAEKSFKVQSSGRSNLPRVALVGYTNAGKSTLMEKLTKAPVYIEDKLFATLETTVRKLNPPTRPQILVSDTVGFVRELPHDLVASFKSTLAEAVDSRILLHVVDSSDPAWPQHFHTTEEVLEEIGAEKVLKILILNKSDNLDIVPRIREAQARRMLADNPQYLGVISVSALQGDGVDELKHILIEECGARIPDWVKAKV